jgi:hypothetical protein
VHGQARVNKFLTTLCYIPSTSLSGLTRRWQGKQRSAYERLKYVLEPGAKNIWIFSGYVIFIGEFRTTGREESIFV